MWQALRRMAEHPSGADELAAFVVAVTVLFILFALTLYAGVMTLAWRVGPRTGKWLSFLFPGFARLRANAWEYGLAALTSLTLTVTLFHKAAVVDAVLAADASAGHASGLGSTVAEAGRAFLRLGQEAAARDEIRRSLERMLGADVRLSTTLTRWLVVACFALLALYLARLLRVRMREAREPPGTDSGSGPGVRKLALVGVCLALLLVSPIPALGTEAMVDTAIRQLKRPAGPEPPVPSPESACVCLPDSTLMKRIAALEGAAGSEPTADPRTASLDSLVRVLQGELRVITAELSAARDSVRELRDRSYLLVLADPEDRYLLGGTPQLVAAGLRSLSAGLHRVGAGAHRIRIRSIGLDTSVSVAPGQVLTLDFRGRSAPVQ